ncbi:MAG: prepilin-type N-terminal cleavage/methylation domain-containing protein [Kiritimatiellia bacterium]
MNANRCLLSGCIAPRKSGFTLVEMLVVIAIMALLAGLLVPAVTSGVERAQTVKCKSQLREISSAALMYASDHGGILPPHRRENSGALGQQILMQEGYLGRYTFKGWGPYSHIRYSGYACPKWGKIEGEPATYVQSGGYGINGNLSYVARADGTTPRVIHTPKSIVQVKNTATTVYWMDSASAGGQAFLKVPPAPGDNQAIHYRHRGGTNIAFVDGHVSWFSGTDLEKFRAQQLEGAYPGSPIVFDPAGRW